MRARIEEKQIVETKLGDLRRNQIVDTEAPAPVNPKSTLPPPISLSNCLSLKAASLD